MKENVKKIVSYLVIALILAQLVYVSTNNKNDPHENPLRNTDSDLKFHFKFDIPMWKENKTCEFRDARPSCKKCITKVKYNLHQQCQDNSQFACVMQPDLWDCVGEDRNWGLVFVDNRPGAKRGSNALRLVKRSQVIIAHDTNQNDALWPKVGDFYNIETFCMKTFSGLDQHKVNTGPSGKATFQNSGRPTTLFGQGEKCTPTSEGPGLHSYR